jgi:hypothetical protein
MDNGEMGRMEESVGTLRIPTTTNSQYSNWRKGQKGEMCANTSNNAYD